MLKLFQIFQIVQSDSGVLLSMYHTKPRPVDKPATDFILYNSARFIRASMLQPFHQSPLMYPATDVTPRFQFHQCHEVTHAAQRFSDVVHKFVTTPHKWSFVRWASHVQYYTSRLSAYQGFWCSLKDGVQQLLKINKKRATVSLRNKDFLLNKHLAHFKPHPIVYKQLA